MVRGACLRSLGEEVVSRVASDASAGEMHLHVYCADGLCGHECFERPLPRIQRPRHVDK